MKLQNLNKFELLLILVIVIVGGVLAQLMVDEETVLVKDEQGNLTTFTVDRKFRNPIKALQNN